MKRLSFLPLTLLLVSTAAFAQTNPHDADTHKSLLAEVRQLRHDLQTTTVAAQRAQILIYRVQAQESIVRRTQERADDARSKLAQIRSEQKSRAASMKQIGEKRSRTETPASEQKDLEDTLAQIKARFDADANTEQETQATLIDAEQQLRMEQAKLAGLQDQLDPWKSRLKVSQAQNSAKGRASNSVTNKERGFTGHPRLQELLDAWFSPKGFESEAFYERLGVLFIKRYVRISEMLECKEVGSPG